jgi:hypothetical protein
MKNYAVSDWNINSKEDVSGVWDHLYTDKEKAISDLRDALKKMYDPDDDLTDKEFFVEEAQTEAGYFVVVNDCEAGGSVKEVRL